MTGMYASVRKYWSLTSVNFSNQLAYAAETVSRGFFILVILFIFVQLWSAVFTSQGSTEIAGLTLSETLWYFLLVEVLEIGRSKHDMTIAEEVKSGTIAYALVRPYNYLGYHFAYSAGETIPKLLLLAGMGLPLILFYAGLPPTTIISAVAALIAVSLALLLNFLIYSIIGLAAFVVEEVGPLRMIYQKLVFVLGGLLLPLDFLPSWLYNIAILLPFQLTTYAPAKLLVDFSWNHFGLTLTLQALWLTIFAVLLRLQYGSAVKRLEVNGG